MLVSIGLAGAGGTSCGGGGVAGATGGTAGLTNRSPGGRRYFFKPVLYLLDWHMVVLYGILHTI
ncbi:unnamed protein product [Acanthoscelides obtectus]|uniref:Uncharacterized protein n=1 Tax=Acanthoscelides obtectus TaxID=200917 RepID=A0A9P0JG05_ACAOB|nr:unnamed protein product [Acanthoscelides obtectus]CAK1661562.1 hypothetical protein AOBTE_LOCUS22685 [Acanthoscelides obtectus]